MSRLQIFVSLLVLTSLVNSHSFYKQHVYNFDPEAKCLDGTSPAYYVHQGSNPENILIYFLGNGTCFKEGLSHNQMLQNCLERSQTNHGSTDFMRQNVNSEDLGILSGDQSCNKFASWTKIVIPSCDGAGFQGYRKDPVQVNGQKIYFRGSINVKSILNWINKKYNFNKAPKIVFAGGSIGGVGAFSWIDYFKEMVEDPSKIYGIVDSGIIQDLDLTLFIYRQRSQYSQFFGLPPKSSIKSGGIVPLTKVHVPLTPKQFGAFVNADGQHPNQNCVSKVGVENAWRCDEPRTALQHLKSKMLWVHSQYDTLVLRFMLGVQCVKIIKPTSIMSPQDCPSQQLVTMDIIRSFTLTKILRPLIERGHSVWSNACGWHLALVRKEVYDDVVHRSSISGNNLTVRQAVERFVFGGKKIQEIDEYPWPFNRKCAFIR